MTSAESETNPVPTESTSFIDKPDLEAGSGGENRVRMDAESQGVRTCSGQTKCLCLTGFIVGLIAFILGMVFSTIHYIDEGYIGIYYKYGALMDSYTGPGMHNMAPFVTTVQQIKIRPDTDTLSTTEAITKDGIQIQFEDVQVISRIKEKSVVPTIKKYGQSFKNPLVFDRVRENIRIFCANNTIDDVYNEKFLDIVQAVRQNIITSIERLGDGAVEILNLVISKPDIPKDIADNYKQVKVQWTEQLVAQQRQNTEQINKETEKIRELADAQRKKEVLEITIQKQILEKEGEQKVSSLANAILKEREENMANIEKYKIESRAQANKNLFTKDYIQLETVRSLSNNTKFYFSGETSPLGSLLSKLIT